MLTISGERIEKERIGLIRRHVRSIGKFLYEVRLPEPVDDHGLRAKLEDGVLTVRVPKTATTKGQRVACHMTASTNGATPLHRPGPGEGAPDFTLPMGPGSSFTLADLRGRPVVLAFYPADWSPVCSDQLSLYQAILSEFELYNAALVAISVDGAWCHRAFAEARGLTFPCLPTSNRKVRYPACTASTASGRA